MILIWVVSATKLRVLRLSQAAWSDRTSVASDDKLKKQGVPECDFTGAIRTGIEFVNRGIGRKLRNGQAHGNDDRQRRRLSNDRAQVLELRTTDVDNDVFRCRPMRMGTLVVPINACAAPSACSASEAPTEGHC